MIKISKKRLNEMAGLIRTDLKVLDDTLLESIDTFSLLDDVELYKAYVNGNLLEDQSLLEEANEAEAEKLKEEVDKLELKMPGLKGLFTTIITVAGVAIAWVCLRKYKKASKQVIDRLMKDDFQNKTSAVEQYLKTGKSKFIRELKKSGFSAADISKLKSERKSLVSMVRTEIFDAVKSKIKSSPGATKDKVKSGLSAVKNKLAKIFGRGDAS
ncbi:MAG: hypothetical protein ACOC3Z_00460 [Nanoarchaeota archaeon]